MDLTRTEAIEDLREALLTLVDDQNSVCQVVSKLGLCCGGFSQWSFSELKRRFRWIADRYPEIDRERLEELANKWMLTRQSVTHGRLPCDVLARSPRQGRGPCAGWDEFYEAELSHFHKELFGCEVRVVPEGYEPKDPDAS